MLEREMQVYTVLFGEPVGQKELLQLSGDCIYKVLWSDWKFNEYSVHAEGFEPTYEIRDWVNDEHSGRERGGAEDKVAVVFQS